MNSILDIDFDNPEEVVLNFIKSSARFSKECPVGPNGSTKNCLAEALELIHYYTYFKYHPYSDHRSGLDSIKNIKEIDCIEEIDKQEIQVHTKNNQTVIPACRFTLKLKKKKWKISEVQIKQGVNKYYSVFIGGR